jgi:hypothetical protein
MEIPGIAITDVWDDLPQKRKLTAADITDLGENLVA